MQVSIKVVRMNNYEGFFWHFTKCNNENNIGKSTRDDKVLVIGISQI